jgi:hypothetical protein
MVSSSPRGISVRVRSVNDTSPDVHATSTFGSQLWLNSDGARYVAVPAAAPVSDDANAASRTSLNDDDD